MLENLPYRRALVVANPVSGQGLGQSVASELSTGLGARGLQTKLHLTSRAGEAREVVAELDPDIDLVVSVGGDGTLREVLMGLRERGAEAQAVRVGIVPMGTGNALCADLGLPRDVDRALEVLLAGKTVETDVADVNGELCFLMTGVGPDAMVVEEVDQSRKRGGLTKWSYFPAALKTYWNYSLTPLEVELDGETLPRTYAQVMACNMIHYGGLVKLSPGRVLDDGLFEVFLFPHGGRFGLALHALRVLLRRVPGRAVEMRRAKRIRVSAASPVPYHVDGDPMGRTPVEIEVTGSRFQLLVP